MHILDSNNRNCISGCENGKFFNIKTRNCELCPLNCFKCTVSDINFSKIECNLCENGYFLTTSSSNSSC
jgi:hypothetical protein